MKPETKKNIKLILIFCVSLLIIFAGYIISEELIWDQRRVETKHWRLTQPGAYFDFGYSILEASNTSLQQGQPISFNQMAELEQEFIMHSDFRFRDTILEEDYMVLRDYKTNNVVLYQWLDSEPLQIKITVLKKDGEKIEKIINRKSR